MSQSQAVILQVVVSDGEPDVNVAVFSGVRMISLSYSRISLADIALKLQLDSPEDAEFIVAKVTRINSRSQKRVHRATAGQIIYMCGSDHIFFLKAIRDGVIEASINHEKGFVQSKETMDIYGTREPQLAFHQRISFCLDIHNMSVKVTLSDTQHVCEGNTLSDTQHVCEGNTLSDTQHVCEGNTLSDTQHVCEGNILSDTQHVCLGNTLSDTQQVCEGNTVRYTTCLWR